MYWKELEARLDANANAPEIREAGEAAGEAEPLAESSGNSGGGDAAGGSGSNGGGDAHERRAKQMLEEHEGQMKQAEEEIANAEMIAEDVKPMRGERNAAKRNKKKKRLKRSMKGNGGRAAGGQSAACGGGGPAACCRPTKKLKKDRFACPGGAPALLMLLAAPLAMEMLMPFDEELEA